MAFDESHTALAVLGRERFFRLEHQLERIANGGLIINDENAGFIFDVGHCWQFYGLVIVTGGTGRSTLMPSFLSLR